MRIDDPVPGSTTTSRTALVLTADKFEDLELVVPWFRLLEAGVDVTIAAPSLGEIGGEHGYSTRPHTTFDHVDPAGYDLLVVPGGFPDGAPATVRDDEAAQRILRAFMSDRRPVASVCHGPWLLASAGVAEGRRMTSYWHDGVPEDLRAAGGIWEDAPVVVDANLVTSRWPPDLPAFCAAMLALLDRSAVLTGDESHAVG